MDINLDGTWTFFIDENNEGNEQRWFSSTWIEKNMNKGRKITIPSNINIIKGLEQFGGVIWYYLKLPEMPYRPKSHEYSIEFEGVNNFAEVWLNGYKIGSHEGGFFPFRFGFTPKMLSFSHDNFLTVRVDTSLSPNGIPSNNIPWFNWSGIYRRVQLLVLEKTRVKQIKIQSSIPNRSADFATIKVDYVLKNPQEFLDRCYAEQKEPQIEYELFYLGRIFGGARQSNKVLIQTGIQDINPESLKPLEKIAHDPQALSGYFSDILISEESFDEPIDLETYFSGREEYSDAKMSISEKPTKLQGDFSETDDGLFKFQEEEKLSNSFQINVKKPALWTPDHPDLYELVLQLHGIDEDKFIRFGIREIKRIKEHIYLNNHPITLRGINLHEESDKWGRAIPKKVRRRDILNIKALGFNAIKTGHYPHDISLCEIADEEGMLIVEELPFYGNINFALKTSKILVKQAIDAILMRDFNNPSIICWSIGYKLPIENRNCNQFLNQLIDYIRQSDPTRLIINPTERITKNTVSKNTDCTGIIFPRNRQKSLPSIINLYLETMFYSSYQKPIIITEFGLPYKNESNEHPLRHVLKQIQLYNAKPFVAGWFLSNFRDHRIIQEKANSKHLYDTRGLFDQFDRPKRIIKYFPRTIASRHDGFHNRRFLGMMVGKLGIWLETFVRIGRFNRENSIKKQNLNFYYKNSQGSNE
ncbi:glycoside hydrolase family 2 protein [Candidatus Lokiarchaeum ossiferum]|uniref:glycoside hydrolase family 2 protein n=1 Tax=Candidatus Lokiarchaeum ossiferum TaxID=2951803 RepID=UPI00352D0D8C